MDIILVKLHKVKLKVNWYYWFPSILVNIPINNSISIKYPSNNYEPLSETPPKKFMWFVLYCIKISSNIKRNEWISTSIYPHHRHREIIFTAVLYPYQYLIVWSILNYQLYFLFKSIGQRYPLKRHTKLELHSLKSLTYFTALSTQVNHHLQ